MLIAELDEYTNLKGRVSKFSKAPRLYIIIYLLKLRHTNIFGKMQWCTKRHKPCNIGVWLGSGRQWSGVSTHKKQVCLKSIMHMYVLQAMCEIRHCAHFIDNVRN